MTAPAVGGPRLVHGTPASVAQAHGFPAPQQPTQRPFLRVVAAALIVGALVAAVIEHRRAESLDLRVSELSASLATARAELVARRQHLDAIRSSVAEMRERVGALESLAGADPAASPVTPDH